MSRDDDETPDPRHDRSGGSSFLIVLLLAGGVVIGLVLFAGAGLLLFRLDARAVPAPAQPVVVEEAKPLHATTPRAGVGVPIAIDGLAVKVVRAEVGKARVLRDAKRNLFVEDDERSLLVRIEMSAADAARTYSYATWRSEKSPAATDDLANTYNARPITVGGSPGWVRTTAIGEKVTDMLAFEPPVVEAGYVDLDLPGENAGVAGTYRFRIPRAAWETK